MRSTELSGDRVVLRTVENGPRKTPVNATSIPVTLRERDFVSALESVRGLAALTVLIFHSAAFLRHGQADTLEKTLWALKSIDELLRRSVTFIFDGHLAVNLFFVLSGFVLALSLRRDHRTFGHQAGGFVGRRFFRIYPALAINLLLTAAVTSIVAASFPSVAFSSFTGKQLVENLLLYKFPVNGATWTLLIELLAVPLLLIGHLLAIRFGPRGLFTLAMVTVALLFNAGLARAIAPGESLYFVRAAIVDCQFMFVFGMLVAEVPARALLVGKSRIAKISMVVVLVAMLSARFLLGYSSRWSLLVEGASAAALIGLLAYGPRLGVHDFLEWRPIRFLGRISYSFYLYHATALALIIPVTTWYMTAPGTQTRPFLAFAIVAVTTTAATIPLALLSYNFVERPMIQLGRRL